MDVLFDGTELSMYRKDDHHFQRLWWYALDKWMNKVKYTPIQVA